MKLPSDWVDRIFTVMTVRYGEQWLRKWEGVPIASVRDDWAVQLGWLWRRPEALNFALDHLPVDAPPNAVQFKAIAARCPDAPYKHLPAPPVDRELARRAAARLREVAESLRSAGTAGPIALRALRAREDAGEKLTPGQRGYLRAAEQTAGSGIDQGVGDTFKPIPRDLWPPGMQRDDATAEFYRQIKRTGRGHKPADRWNGREGASE